MISSANAETLPTDLGQLIEEHEGREFTVYNDTAGNPTVGVGFNLNRSDAKKVLKSVGADYDKIISGKQSLTNEQVAKIKEVTVNEAIKHVKRKIPSFNKLSDSRQSAIVDMMFNLGVGKFSGFNKFISAVKRGDFNKAADEVLNSKAAKDLPRRYNRIAELIRKG